MSTIESLRGKCDWAPCIVRLVLILALLAPATAGADGPEPVGVWHGYTEAGPLDDHDEARREEVLQIVRENVQRLVAEGRMQTAKAGAESPVFAWPLRDNRSAPPPDFESVGNFVDHNPAFPNALLDYDCGTRSYDTTSGYNHQGMDAGAWPFAWLTMDQEVIEYVAAAPGQIVFRNDGSFDRNCALNSDPANAVILQHEDGSRTWYWHMKQGSVTSKGVGEFVGQGEYLGLMGSSGSSTAPHIHFEVEDKNGNLIDPFAGPCNGLNAESWWADQRPYFNSGLNDLFTISEAPEFPACPQPEIPHRTNVFEPGGVGFFAAFYHDQQAGQITHYRIRYPDGSVWIQWDHSLDTGWFSASWWLWAWGLPFGPTGVYTFEAEFLGDTFQYPFGIGIEELLAPLNPGWTMVGPALDVDYTASAMCNDIAADGGNPVEIDQFTAGGWEGHICGLPFGDFPIVPGRGYFVRSDGGGDWQQLAGSIATPLDIPLSIGWNGLSLPSWATGWTAAALCEAIAANDGSPVEIDQFVNGGWDGHLCGLPFNNFALIPGNGYFVRADSASTLPLSLAEGAGPVESQGSPARSDETASSRIEPALEANSLLDGPHFANHTATAFAVVWKTARPTAGFVTVEMPDGSRRHVADVRGTDHVSRVHMAVVEGLAPASDYGIEIAGIPRRRWPTRTGVTLPIPRPITRWGKVDDPGRSSVVLVRADTAATPRLLASIVEDGYWSVNLGNLRNADLSAQARASSETPLAALELDEGPEATLGR